MDAVYDARDIFTELYMKEEETEGRLLLEKAISILHFLEATALYEKGYWSEAIISYEMSNTLFPGGVPTTLEWLARAYDRNNQPEEFFDTWARALAINPTPSDKNVWPVYCHR